MVMIRSGMRGRTTQSQLRARYALKRIRAAGQSSDCGLFGIELFLQEDAEEHPFDVVRGVTENHNIVSHVYWCFGVVSFGKLIGYTIES